MKRYWTTGIGCFLAVSSRTGTRREYLCPIELWRSRLYDLGWFMVARVLPCASRHSYILYNACMNKYIARQANVEDTCTGRFWPRQRFLAPAAFVPPCTAGGRYKSQAVLDEAAVLACVVYVDLNPIRAKLAETPEESKFTSLYERIMGFRAKSTGAEIQAKTTSRQSTPKGLLSLAGAESMKSPENSLPYDFLDYLVIGDWTGRAVREDKRGAIPEHLAPILVRLWIEPNNWLETVSQIEGRYYRVMGPVDQLRAYAASVGMKWCQGMSRCYLFYRASPT